MKAITVVLLTIFALSFTGEDTLKARCTNVEGNTWDCIVFVVEDGQKVAKCTDIRVTARTKRKAKRKAAQRAVCTEF